jgi:hypothetical protein
MNRLQARGFPVTIVDEAAGTSRRIQVPTRDQFFTSLIEATPYDDEPNDEEPKEVEIIGHVGPYSAVLRFWSPLPADEARDVVAAAIVRWEAGQSMPGEVRS